MAGRGRRKWEKRPQNFTHIKFVVEEAHGVVPTYGMHPLASAWFKSVVIYGKSTGPCPFVFDRRAWPTFEQPGSEN